jgi:hypothetical protein
MNQRVDKVDANLLTITHGLSGPHALQGAEHNHQQSNLIVG